MKTKQSTISSILYCLLYTVIIAGVLVLVNLKLFFPKESHFSSSVQAQIEYPLSKVTVRIKAHMLKQAIKNCDWIDYSSSLTSHRITIYPKSGHESEYNATVNENNQAERISNLYSDEGFSWDAVTGKFVLSGNSEGVLVPTWILYKLALDNALN